MASCIEHLAETETRADDLESDFRVLLGVDQTSAQRKFASMLSGRRINVQMLNDADELCSHSESVPRCLAVISPKFFQRFSVETKRIFPRSKLRIPFVLWVDDEPIDWEQALEAMRLGAADVVHGEASERELLNVINAFHSSGSVNSFGQSTTTSAENGPGDTNLKIDEKRVKARFGLDMERHASVSSYRSSAPAGLVDLLPESQISMKDVDMEPVSELRNVICGESAPLQEIRELIVEVADTNASVMIYGERGTGKELVAHAIHRLSRRAEMPFVPVNMSAIPVEMADSMLFGHAKVAHTNALHEQSGWCAMADGGTLFLDEIGEMEQSLQLKLLRFLQEGSTQPEGLRHRSGGDVRLITTTNRDPKVLVQNGQMREDLFFRLFVVPIYIPPLRERRTDIIELSQLFLRRSAARHGRSVCGITEAAMEILTKCDWPGNVRQLENAIERIVIFSRHNWVRATDIPAEFHSVAFSPQLEKSNHNEAWSDNTSNASSLTPIQMAERTAIIAALHKTGGHVVDASRQLGLGQATLYRKIKQYGIPHKRKRRRVVPK